MPPPPSRSSERRALARAVRVLRAERDLSQEEVERAGGLGVNAVGRAERGTSSPSFDTLVGIAAGLGVTLSELIAEVERQLRR